MDNIMKEEIEFVMKNFDLAEIVEFTIKNRVEIVGTDDWQYGCYINRIKHTGCWAVELTPLSALIIGIKKYKQEHK